MRRGSGLDGAGDLGDRAFLNLQLGVRGPQGDGVVLDAGHDADDARRGHDLVPFFQGLDQFSLLLRLLLLGADEHDVEDHDHERDHPDLKEVGALGVLRGRLTEERKKAGSKGQHG